MSGSGLDSIGIGKLPDFTPPPVKPDMKDSASTVNNGSVKAEHVPDFQHTALLFGDRSEASGNGGGVKAIVDILATIGIISAEVARNLWQAITETDGNGVSSSRPDGPDIPWAEPGEDEVRIRNGDTGMDEVIFERGPIEPAGNSEDETDIGDGGDNNITLWKVQMGERIRVVGD